MLNSSWFSNARAKVVLAFVLLGGLVVLAGTSLAPQRSPWQVLAIALAAAALVLAVLIVVVVLGLTLRQWVLRRGGTDVQWFWFDAEPAGLVALRRRARIEAEATDAH